MATRKSAKLVREMGKIIDSWPVVKDRAGRDLGEFLRGHYKSGFHRTCDSNISYAEAEVEALKKLQSNFYYKKFQRAEDTTFTGKAASWGFTQLATSAQATFNKGRFFDKFITKKD